MHKLPCLHLALATCLSVVLPAQQAALDNLPTAPLGMALSNGVWVTVGY